MEGISVKIISVNEQSVKEKSVKAQNEKEQIAKEQNTKEQSSEAQSTKEKIKKGIKEKRKRAKRIISGETAELLLQLIFPPRCPFCDRIQRFSRQGICDDCRRKIKYIKEPRCMKCGKQLAEEEREYCRDCTKRPHLFRQGRALYDYASAAGAIYRFKYKGKREYGGILGEEVAYFLGDYISCLQPDVLVPVPLHPSRKRARGYNQAEVLAEVIGERLNVPVEAHLVKRIRKTKALKSLNPKERLNNLKNAFILDRNSVKLDTVIIVDDIYTTGSTIDAIAGVLIEAGVKKVFFITLAIGEGV